MTEEAPKAMAPPTLGILVGGQGQRMGGAAKGLLRLQSTGLNIIETLRARFAAVCPTGRVLLVGKHPAYAEFNWATVEDSPSGIGPLGGLRALLAATERCAWTIAIGGDMPFVTETAFARLLEHPSRAPALCLRQANGALEPLCTRYRAADALAVVDAQIAAGRFALRDALRALGAESFTLGGDTNVAQDWDTPEDRDALPA